MQAMTLIQGVTNYWCRTKGIHNRDLDTHPQIDDVVLLVKYRTAMWTKLNKTEQGHWGAVWSWTYHHKMPLKAKHLKKLELITIEAEARHLAKLIAESRAREKIKKLRQRV